MGSHLPPEDRRANLLASFLSQAQGVEIFAIGEIPVGERGAPQTRFVSTITKF